MTIDPLASVGLAAREVRSGTRDGAPTRIVVARRTYATDQADLWNALTDAERIPRWFLPISGDLRPGGRYQLEGNAGGVVERCDEPEGFSVTWEMREQVSWLAVTLSPVAEGTLLELTHEAPVDPAFWEQFGPGAVGLGWDLGLWGLGLHVERGGAIVAPAAGEAFRGSPEGDAFLREAADAWAAAAIADGDEPEAARAAAERVLAAYTATS
jgi:uncharacterized protein YndB with AHSA1/START domain